METKKAESTTCWYYSKNIRDYHNGFYASHEAHIAELEAEPSSWGSASSLAHKLLSAVEPEGSVEVANSWDKEIRNRIARYYQEEILSHPEVRSLKNWILKPSMIVEFLENDEEELIETAIWYEPKEIGLGVRFRDEIVRVIRRIA